VSGREKHTIKYAQVNGVVGEALLVKLIRKVNILLFINGIKDMERL
jgi:hypothetical protein